MLCWMQPRGDGMTTEARKRGSGFAELRCCGFWWEVEVRAPGHCNCLCGTTTTHYTKQEAMTAEEPGCPTGECCCTSTVAKTQLRSSEHVGGCDHEEPAIL